MAQRSSRAGKKRHTEKKLAAKRTKAWKKGGDEQGYEPPAGSQNIELLLAEASDDWVTAVAIGMDPVATSVTEFVEPMPTGYVDEEDQLGVYHYARFAYDPHDLPDEVPSEECGLAAFGLDTERMHVHDELPRDWGVTLYDFSSASTNPGRATHIIDRLRAGRPINGADLEAVAVAPVEEEPEPEPERPKVLQWVPLRDDEEARKDPYLALVDTNSGFAYLLGRTFKPSGFENLVTSAEVGQWVQGHRQGLIPHPSAETPSSYMLREFYYAGSDPATSITKTSSS